MHLQLNTKHKHSVTAVISAEGGGQLLVTRDSS